MSPRADIVVGCIMLCVAALIAMLTYFGSRPAGQQTVTGMLTSVESVESGSGRTRRFRQVATLRDANGALVRFQVTPSVARLMRDSALPIEVTALIESDRSTPKAMQVTLGGTDVYSEQDYRSERSRTAVFAGLGAFLSALIGIGLLALGVRRRTTVALAREGA